VADQSANRDTIFGSLQVSVPAGTVTIENTSGSPYASGFPDKIWRMISVPLDLDDKSIATVLDGWGPSGDKTWKLFDQTQEISSSTTTHFDLGKAYWLKQIDVPNGTPGKQITINQASKTWSGSFPITLSPGFNMIANPFTFPIDWNADTDADQSPLIKGPIRYDGNKYIGPGQGDSTKFTTLNPWDGYWVYNAGSSNQVLTIDPSGTLSKRKKSRTILQPNWQINFSAKAGEFEDSYNFIGTAQDASAGEDYHDLSELPVMGDYVSLSFGHENNLGKRLPYTLDYREANTDGQVWTMEVRTNLRDKENILNWTAKDLPSNYVIKLLDISNNKVVENTGYRFSNHFEDHPVSFKVFVGTADFVERELTKSQSELPTTFQLEQNYPNPFNPSTVITYQLPVTSKVQLKIYNSLGQEVRTLISNTINETGTYRITWDGRSNTGAQVASGVYIYRLVSGSFVRSRKMVLVK